jgi:hypothetical protein
LIPTFNPSAEEIMRRDGQEWKRRALAAEAKLSGYKRLREAGDEVIRRHVMKDKAAKADAIDNLAEELSCLDVVDASPDFFNQSVQLGEATIVVRTRAGIGHCSTLDIEHAVIEIEALQPDEGRAIGLFFQVLQLADVASSRMTQLEQAFSGEYLHNFTPAFLALACELGIIDRRLNITAASLDAYVTNLYRERDAAREEGKAASSTQPE